MPIYLGIYRKGPSPPRFYRTEKGLAVSGFIEICRACQDLFRLFDAHDSQPKPAYGWYRDSQIEGAASTPSTNQLSSFSK